MVKASIKRLKVAEDKNEQGGRREVASSEVSNAQPDSAYSSLGHSAYSSLGPIRPKNSSLAFSQSNSNSNSHGTSRSSKQNLSSNSNSSKQNSSSKSSGCSGRSTQPGAAVPEPVKPQEASLTMLEKKEPTERPPRKKKAKISYSGTKEPVKSAADKTGAATSHSQESKAAKVASLSQALGYVEQFRKIQALRFEKAGRGTDDDINDLAINLLGASKNFGIQAAVEQPSLNLEDREKIPEDTIVKHEKKEGDGFCVAVSLHDGMVMQTTASLTSILGYPKDMWVGRSFIDFVHPQDRETFINQVTENVGLILRDQHTDRGKPEAVDTYRKSGCFFCRIRIYNGLKSGFSVKERKTRYNPFKLSVCFSEMDSKGSGRTPESSNPVSGPHSTFLFITAIPLISSYSEPYEDISIKQENSGQHIFVTKHNASCVFSNIDETAIPYLGYLPQDINGQDIFKFIHPQDLPYIKEVFENAMLEQGKAIKSRNIRFKVRNGGFILVNSWWSCFINPWSRQLEFVNGKHSVTKGPRHPDVFADFLKEAEEPQTLVEDSETHAIAVQNDIRNTLKKTVQRNTFLDTNFNNTSKTRKELSSFMGSLLEEVAKAESNKLSRSGNIKAFVIGNISPHQSDSSENPPSYTQLTYNENLTRFFNSQPKTLLDKVDVHRDASQGHSKTSEDTNLSGSKEDGGRSAQGSGASGEPTQTGSGTGHNSSTLQTGLSAGQVQSGRDYGMMSQDGSGSGSRLGSGSGDTSLDQYSPPLLTQELLVIHNKDMERKMLCKYKQDKRSGDIRFLKDHKYKLAQNTALKGGNIQQGSRQPGGDITENPKKVSNPFDKDGKTISRFEPDLLGRPGNLQIWANCDESIPIQASFNKVQGQQGHEGHVGFNQANMMQRGTPTSAPGFTSSVGVTTLYMTFGGNSASNPNQNSTQVPSGMNITLERGSRYVPFSVLDTVPGVFFSQLGLPSTSGLGPNSKTNQELNKSPTHQPALPNCLAVNSCIICPNSNIPNFNNDSKFARPLSRAGSRASSVKGEPGSALESNASVSVKDKIILSPGILQAVGNMVTKEKETDQQSTSTSSSSLYSFLKTSEDYSLTNEDSQHLSGDETQVQNYVAKPVLSEPFWNEKVELSKELEYCYQLEVKSLEEILRSDRERLGVLNQFPEVGEQLKELLSGPEDVEDLNFGLLENESISSCESSSADEGTSEDGDVLRVKRLKMKAHLENLNIFFEADAPFPLAEPRKLELANKKSWMIINPSLEAEWEKKMNSSSVSRSSNAGSFKSGSTSPTQNNSENGSGKNSQISQTNTKQPTGESVSQLSGAKPEPEPSSIEPQPSQTGANPEQEMESCSQPSSGESEAMSVSFNAP